jgi:uncharacterized protein YkwD
VGVEDRDWYRTSSRPPIHSSFRGRPGAAAIVVSLLATIVLGSSYGLHRALPGRASPAVNIARPPVGAPPLYPDNDAWRAWLAPESVCPGGSQVNSPATEFAAMACLINYARQQQGLTPIAFIETLNSASAAKAADIARCRVFEHDACGKPGNQVAIDAGYQGSFGENLYGAEGRYTAPRAALDGWLNSPRHRENLFRPEWRTGGIAALHGASFGEHRNAVIWVSEFGDR